MRAMRMYYPRGFCGIKSKSKIKNVFENIIFPYPERGGNIFHLSLT